MFLGLTDCDNRKAETETLSPTNSRPTAPVPEAELTEAPVVRAKTKPGTPAQPVVDGQMVFDGKMDVYIEYYNELRVPIQHSPVRYADWLRDFKQGPTGEERTVYGIYGINESDLAERRRGVKGAVVLMLALQPIDDVAVSYIDAAVTLDNTVNETDKYYIQENYKGDAFAKGKTLHQTSLKDLEAFEPAAEPYHTAIQEINDECQLAELRNTEKGEGEAFYYYSLTVMISAKQINSLISQDKFDTEVAMKRVSELETLVVQTKETGKGDMNFPFISSAGQYQPEARKYVRRIRDKVLYSDWDKEQLQDVNPSWMVEDSFPRALREYNEMTNDYNSLR